MAYLKKSLSGSSKLSEALALHPDVLEYVIISLNPHDFNRLRSPILRKVMPPRISLRRVAAMVGISEQEFLNRIEEIALKEPSSRPGSDEKSHESTVEPDRSNDQHSAKGDSDDDSEFASHAVLPSSPSDPPPWLDGVDLEKIRWVDVTPIDAQLGDPMPPINVAINTAKPGDVIGIVHKWEPQPFYDIWHARGFQFWSKNVGPDEWHIFVFRAR